MARPAGVTESGWIKRLTDGADAFGSTADQGLAAALFPRSEKVMAMQGLLFAAISLVVIAVAIFVISRLPPSDIDPDDRAW